MRHFLFASAFLAASPALAEVIEMTAPPVAVTLYPQGASITRQVAQDLPAGIHQIVVAGLPAGTDPNSLRVSAEGATLGAFSLQTARPLPEDLTEPSEVTEARAEVFRLEREMRARDAEVEMIRAEIVAAEDLVSYLKSLAKEDGDDGDLAVRTDFVADRLLKARHAAVEAETRAQAASQGRDQDQRALDAARQRLEALERPDDGRLTLVMNVESTGAPARFEITSVAEAAGWRPVYDLRLTEAEKSLSMDRGLMVSQWTGEDWQGVRLTMSTARPSGQSAPSELFAQILRFYDPKEVPPPQPPMPVAADAMMVEADAAVGGMMNRIEAAPRVAYQGSVVIYPYDTPVDLRSGADELRLSLGQVSLPVDALVAEAVPSRDSSAYLVADSTNPLEEVILPGQATLYADGGMVGQAALDLIPAGEEMKLGFGPIDGIVLERRVPERAEGGRGMIRRATAIEQQVILSAKNLTGRDYDLRLIDQVPVSEQDDLQIAWQASVKPTETDPDGERGLLVWELPLAAGETTEITVDSTVAWPEGMRLDN